LKTTGFPEKDEQSIQEASKVDDSIQGIKKNLLKGETGLKGIVLGLCQGKNELLWYRGKIWIPKDKELRTSRIAKHHTVPVAGHGGTATTNKLMS